MLAENVEGEDDLEKEEEGQSTNYGMIQHYSPQLQMLVQVDYRTGYSIQDQK